MRSPASVNLPAAPFMTPPTLLRPAGARTERPTLLVLSHLRWGFVFQRPQHVLSRLAAHADILFVEEPVHDPETQRLAITAVAPGVEVVTPHLGDPAPGFADVHFQPLGRMLDELLAQRRVRSPLAWFYTPMALPILKYLEPCGIVYDCMDDLASFRFAPAELLKREARLLDLADVVLTGGPSLHATRKARRPDARCLPSAVDVEHFARSRLDARGDEAAAAAALHVGIPGPRLGYMGVIGERLDLHLLDELARHRPDWSFVMVGPVVKITPASLPDRPNIHWLGMAPYALLPYLLAHWDLALMPFALNEATRFISPTKTLEYLASGLAVVSTPVPDVVSLYGHVVRVASGAEGFERAIEQELARPAAGNPRHVDELASLLRSSTWDAMVSRVAAAIQPWLGEPPAETVDRSRAGAAREPVATRGEAARPIGS
jgi:UDP-galactopyranose mutase